MRIRDPRRARPLLLAALAVATVALPAIVATPAGALTTTTTVTFQCTAPTWAKGGDEGMANAIADAVNPAFVNPFQVSVTYTRPLLTRAGNRVNVSGTAAFSTQIGATTVPATVKVLAAGNYSDDPAFTATNQVSVSTVGPGAIVSPSGQLAPQTVITSTSQPTALTFNASFTGSIDVAPATPDGALVGLRPTQFTIPLDVRASFFSVWGRIRGNIVCNSQGSDQVGDIEVNTPASRCIGSPPHGFTDVPSGAFFDAPVSWLVATEITAGMTPTTFGPGSSVTRGQMATFLWRFRGVPVGHPSPGFTDVPSGAFFALAVAYMKHAGITSGLTASTFGPNSAVTRGQMATFLWRLAGEPTGAPDAGFADVAPTAFYATAVNFLKDAGITSGLTPSTFGPNAAVTRGQMATFLNRYACVAGQI